MARPALPAGPASGLRVDGRLIGTVLLGFAGVAMVLRPTMEHDQLWPGLIGLLSGMLAAMAYLQVTALGRAGEPEYRVVFYFSIGSMVSAGLPVIRPSAKTMKLAISSVPNACTRRTMIGAMRTEGPESRAASRLPAVRGVQARC